MGVCGQSVEAQARHHRRCVREHSAVKVASRSSKKNKIKIIHGTIGRGLPSATAIWVRVHKTISYLFMHRNRHFYRSISYERNKTELYFFQANPSVFIGVSSNFAFFGISDGIFGDEIKTFNQIYLMLMIQLMKNGKLNLILRLLKGDESIRKSPVWCAWII